MAPPPAPWRLGRPARKSPALELPLPIGAGASTSNGIAGKSGPKVNVGHHLTPTGTIAAIAASTANPGGDEPLIDTRNDLEHGSYLPQMLPPSMPSAPGGPQRLSTPSVVIAGSASGKESSAIAPSTDKSRHEDPGGTTEDEEEEELMRNESAAALQGLDRSLAHTAGGDHIDPSGTMAYDRNQILEVLISYSSDESSTSQPPVHSVRRRGGGRRGRGRWKAVSPAMGIRPPRLQPSAAAGAGDGGEQHPPGGMVIPSSGATDAESMEDGESTMVDSAFPETGLPRGHRSRQPSVPRGQQEPHPEELPHSIFQGSPQGSWQRRKTSNSPLRDYGQKDSDGAQALHALPWWRQQLPPTRAPRGSDLRRRLHGAGTLFPADSEAIEGELEALKGIQSAPKGTPASKRQSPVADRAISTRQRPLTSGLVDDRGGDSNGEGKTHPAAQAVPQSAASMQAAVEQLQNLLAQAQAVQAAAVAAAAAIPSSSRDTAADTAADAAKAASAPFESRKRRRREEDLTVSGEGISPSGSGQGGQSWLRSEVLVSPPQSVQAWPRPRRHWTCSPTKCYVNIMPQKEAEDFCRKAQAVSRLIFQHPRLVPTEKRELAVALWGIMLGVQGIELARMAPRLLKELASSATVAPLLTSTTSVPEPAPRPPVSPILTSRRLQELRWKRLEQQRQEGSVVENVAPIRSADSEGETSGEAESSIAGTDTEARAAKLRKLRGGNLVSQELGSGGEEALPAWQAPEVLEASRSNRLPRSKKKRPPSAAGKGPRPFDSSWAGVDLENFTNVDTVNGVGSGEEAATARGSHAAGTILKAGWSPTGPELVSLHSDHEGSQNRAVQRHRPRRLVRLIGASRKRGLWDAEELRLLFEYVNRYGPGNWGVLQKITEGRVNRDQFQIEGKWRQLIMSKQVGKEPNGRYYLWRKGDPVNELQ